MRALLIPAIIVLQLLLGWLLYRDQKQCCVPDAPAITVPVKNGPLLFRWASSDPVTNEALPGYIDSVAALVVENQKLEIIGWYCDDEKSNINPDSLAIERAQKTRSFFKNLPDDQCILTTKKVDCNTLSRQQLFEGIQFQLRTITENIIETKNETLIYFPSNSTDKLNAVDVEAYLDKVALVMVTSGGKISLTGHTDNVGPEEPNLKLGLKRAEIIKKHLISKGVNEASISVDSQGELMPVADNNTAEGRAKNRRTVLKFIK